MKEITPNIRAKIFSLHLGCKIQYPDVDDRLIKAKLTCVATDYIESTYARRKKGCMGDILSFKPTNKTHNSNALNAKILVNPLSSISDEDAQCIYEIQEYVGKVGSLHFHTTGISLHASIKPLNNTSVNYEPVYSNAIDYLRSKGYALPAFGYSVSELVQAGIFKLIEN